MSPEAIACAAEYFLRRMADGAMIHMAQVKACTKISGFDRNGTCQSSNNEVLRWEQSYSQFRMMAHWQACLGDVAYRAGNICSSLR